MQINKVCYRQHIILQQRVSVHGVADVFIVGFKFIQVKIFFFKIIFIKLFQFLLFVFAGNFFLQVIAENMPMSAKKEERAALALAFFSAVSQCTGLAACTEASGNNITPTTIISLIHFFIINSSYIILIYL